MKSEDIQRELDELWQRVTTGPVPAAPGQYAPMPPPVSGGDISAMTREASLEAISYLRKQHNAEVLRLRHFAELKERSAREMADRLREAETETAGLRSKAARGEAVLSEHLDKVSTELEDAQKMLHLQEERFRVEEERLRSVAQRTREQLAAETERWRDLERQWNEREQQYLLDVRELQARAERATEESAAHEARSRHSLNDLRESKNAIEKTLAELLRERQERAQSDKAREKALQRVGEVEEHMRGLQNLWDAERKQWQELWDRERSTWEAQKQEYAKWEGTLRNERKEWSGQLSTMREREAKFHETMAESLRKSSAVGEKITSMLQFAASKAVDVISMKPGASAAAGTVRASGAAVAPPRPVNWRKVLTAAAVSLLLLGSYPLWQYAHRLRFELVESHVLAPDNPTSIAFDGNVLLLSLWDGSIISLDPGEPANIVSRQHIKKAGAYHPNSLAIWADALYTLDTAQARVLRHSLAAPENIRAVWPSPGPAPVVLAHDGKNLWSYDAATRAVYRHLGEGKDSQAEAYKLELDVLPSAIAWFKEELWVYDIKGRQIMIFKIDGKSLELVRAKEFPTILQSLLITYRADKKGEQQFELWGLNVPGEGAQPPTLKKYRIKR